jgi:ABC-type multidrug transport system ATPase subunit
MIVRIPCISMFWNPQVVQGLAKLSQMGRTVVAVIHQPRAAVFDLFDHVVLLGSKGRV